jgi:hypothetical protein
MLFSYDERKSRSQFLPTKGVLIELDSPLRNKEPENLHELSPAI